MSDKIKETLSGLIDIAAAAAMPLGSAVQTAKDIIDIVTTPGNFVGSAKDENKD